MKVLSVYLIHTIVDGYTVPSHSLTVMRYVRVAAFDSISAQTAALNFEEQRIRNVYPDFVYHQSESRCVQVLAGIDCIGESVLYHDEVRQQ